MKKKYLAIVIVLILTCCLCGCEFLSSKVEDIEGSISGITFNIDTFDNYGELTLKTHGEKISVSPNIVNEQIYTDTGWGYVETVSSVITITIDGKEMESCGDTCIFYEDSIKPVYDFQVNEINSTSDSFDDNAIIAKSVNRIKNLIGKKRVIIIKSQMGQPIYAFAGDSVYWEVSENLPKFTKISIDGHAMYIHRANFQIIDTELID